MTVSPRDSAPIVLQSRLCVTNRRVFYRRKNNRTAPSFHLNAAIGSGLGDIGGCT
jgi:hypothetical protein